MADKVNRTYSISKDVVRDFKIEATYRGVDMSETIENFMIYFTKSSIEQRSKDNESKG